MFISDNNDLSIDTRQSRTVYLSNDIKKYAVIVGNSSIANQAHLLSSKAFNGSFMDAKPLYGEKALRELVVEALQKIHGDISRLESSQRRAFAGNILEEIEKLIKLWENFSLIKSKLARLGDLALIFPAPHNNAHGFQIERKIFRNRLREHMAEELSSLDSINALLEYSEFFLRKIKEENKTELTELVEEFENLREEIYCDALVALS